MVTVTESSNSIKLSLNKEDTEDWADCWPNSKVAGKSLFAEFDANGLLTCRIGGTEDTTIPGDEFDAIISDFLSRYLEKKHPCYQITVGQFNE